MAKTRNKQEKSSNKQAKPTLPNAPAEATDAAAPTPVEKKPEPKKVDLNKAKVKQAIAQGKEIIKEGKSKADAARAIYAVLKDEDKDVIVAAFIEGATLTAKGALTYWYNCRRKAVKDTKKPAE